MNLFVVIDYQNDFVDCSLGFLKSPLLDPKIADKIYECHKKGYKIIATMDTHFDDYLQTKEGEYLPIPHCIKNSYGWQLYGETKKAIEKVNAVIIEKCTFGINPAEFNSEFFRKLGNVEKIEFAGVVTNMCVLANVVLFKSHYPNSEIIVHSELCNSFDSELHEKALLILENLHIKIV